MSPSLPPQSRLPRPLSQQNVRSPGVVSPTSRGARNIRPLVYAIGIAAIVGSGAWIGAYLKTGQQQHAARKERIQDIQLALRRTVPLYRRNANKVCASQQQAQRLVTQPQIQHVPQQAEASVQPTTPSPGEKEYNQQIQRLESKRAQLLAQRLGLETKLRDFHESQRRKAEEDKQRKEFGLKR